MTEPSRAKIAFAIAALCIIWGTTWSVIQIGLAGIPPISGVALRFAIASALLLVLCAIRGVHPGRSPRERRLWLSNGILAFAVSYGVVYWAEQWVPSSLASVLFATYPLFVAPLAHLLLPAESASAGEAVGLVVGFLGIVVIFSADFGALGGSQVALAAAVMLISPLAAALSTVFVKKWGHGIHPYSLTAVPMGICAGIMGALALTLERDHRFDWNPTSVGALLYLAVFGSAVTFATYYWLLARIPAKRLALMTYVIPVVAALIGVARGEPFTVSTVLGSLLVIGGVALTVQLPGGRRSGSSEDAPAAPARDGVR